MPKITGRARYEDDDDPEAIHHVTSEFEVTPDGAAVRVGNRHGVVHPKDVIEMTGPLERRVVQRYVTAVQRANYRNSPARPVPKPARATETSTAATHHVCVYCGDAGEVEWRDGFWTPCLHCQRPETPQDDEE